MKGTGVQVAAALAAMLGWGAVRAGSDEAADAAARLAPVPAVKTLPASRTVMFAPAAAANAKRMTAQQHEERRFLKNAAAASRFEAEASRLALGRSSDAGVRSLAVMLINHHTSAGNELVHMLHGRSMAPPMLSNEQRRTLNHLARLQGRKFDREFVEQVGLRCQWEDVAFYERAGLAARDPRLKAWIGRTLPTLRYHLTTAQRIAPPPDTWLAKAGAGNANPPPPIRHAVAQVPASDSRLASRIGPATRSMGAGPSQPDAAQLGVTQLGNAQPGVNELVLTR